MPVLTQEFEAVNATEALGKFHALVLEDDEISSDLEAQTIRFEVPCAVVMEAHSIAEAKSLLARHRFHFFILDICLPDGSGIDFLYDIQATNPEAGVAIVSGQPVPEYLDQANAFGVLNFMAKPVDPRALCTLIRTHYRKVFAGPASSDTGFFSASLRHLTTIDIVQLKCLQCATTTLEFVAKRGGRGRIYFEDGEIIHAETESAKGMEAFNLIISWRGGEATEVHMPQFPGRTIDEGWQNLLLNAVQWADEQRPKAGV